MDAAGQAQQPGQRLPHNFIGRVAIEALRSPAPRLYGAVERKAKHTILGQRQDGREHLFRPRAERHAHLFLSERQDTFAQVNNFPKWFCSRRREGWA